MCIRLNGFKELHSLCEQFQNLNFMAQSSENKKKNNKSRTNASHDTNLSFESEDFNHSCAPILHLLTFQQSQRCAAPKLPLKSLMHKCLNNQKKNIPVEVLNSLNKPFLHIAYFCMYCAKNL